MDLKSVQTEVDASFLYKILSDNEEDPNVKSVFQEMSEIENSHAVHFLKDKGYSPDKMPKPSIRAKLIVFFGKIFGNDFILGTLLDTEKSLSYGIKNARKQGDLETSISDISHVQILQNLIEHNDKIAGSSLSRFERRHHSIGGNALRAAVLGGNDGLLSTFSLVMGVAGATADQHTVMLTGIAGLLAGSFAMSLGEWISVKSSQELYENQMEIEKEELHINPEGEEREIALIYQAKGIPKEKSKEMATELMKNRENAYKFLVKEELGIDEKEMKNSPWEAAFASFFMFAAGAIIPLFPFFFVGGNLGVFWSVLCSVIGLFAIGALITLFTGKNFWYSGGRMVVFGLLAASITYGIGYMIGVNA